MKVEGQQQQVGGCHMMMSSTDLVVNADRVSLVAIHSGRNRGRFLTSASEYRPEQAREQERGGQGDRVTGPPSPRLPSHGCTRAGMLIACGMCGAGEDAVLRAALTLCASMLLLCFLPTRQREDAVGQVCMYLPCRQQFCSRKPDISHGPVLRPCSSMISVQSRTLPRPQGLRCCPAP